MKRRLLTRALALSMALSLISSVPAFGQTDTTQEANNTGTKESTVTINSTSSFKVTVPSTITVSQSAKAALDENYTVKVEGDITGTETVKVVPDRSFNLTQSGKSDIPVTVNQPKTDFTYDEINVTNGSTTTGTMSTDTEVTAGTWTGNLTFNINIEDSGSTPVTLAAGLYETGTTNMLKSWQELLDEDIIYVTDGVLKSNDGYYCNGSTDDLVGDLVIDNSVTSIGDYGLWYCEELTKVTMPNSVKKISGCAFFECTSLTSITIPSSVTTIEDSVFDCSVNLTEINVEENNPNFSSVDGVLFNKDKTEIIRYPEGKADLAIYSIPESVTTIKRWAFYKCMNLTNIYIPTSVTTIDDDAFPDVPSVTYYGSLTGSPWGARCINKYVDGDFVYEDSTKTKLVAARQRPNIVIPNGVKEIGDNVFYDFRKLTNITIPEGVTKIGYSAFRFCENLNDVIIPDTVTSVNSSAFIGVHHIIYNGQASGAPWGADLIN